MTTALETLSLLTENTVIAGYKTRAVYTNHLGKPLGARFEHHSGMLVDLLYFNSLPQVSVCFQTPPTGDGGEPHALEHIVLGKGKKGKSLSLLFDMCLSENTAATYPDVTNYQFSCAGGIDAFWRLLGPFMDALLSPDFSDEEVRGEVYRLDAVADRSGSVALEEKGTVYNEMVAAAEKPGYGAWRKMAKLAFGEKHPLALESGGDPATMRAMAPSAIRAFHARNYRIGPSVSLVAAMPPQTGVAEFLEKLSTLLDKASGGKIAAAAPELPDFNSAPKPEIWIGSYPADDGDIPQDAFFTWKPRRQLGCEEAIELSIFLELLAGGETSYLYRDLVDSDTCTVDCGAAAVGCFLDDAPSNLPAVYIAGLPAANITPKALETIRAAIMKRIKRMADGRDLSDMREKALSIISSRRRSMLKFIDSPPRFGDRNGGLAWHKHLESLSVLGGFMRNVPQTALMDSLEAKLRSGENIWRPVAESCNLLSTPYACSVKPDATLSRSKTEAKEKRLAAGLAGLEKLYGLKGEDAMRRRYEESAARENALAAELSAIEKPSFIRNPPLTLDDGITVTPSSLPCGRPAITACAGDTPFTDMTLFFDMRVLSREEFIYAPLLPGVLTGLGVATASGEKLDYAQMIERWRAEIFSLASFISANTVSGRLELALSVSASSAAEIKPASGWLENCLLRSALAMHNAGRLRDIADESVQEVRNMMSRSEEYWVRDVATGFFHSDDPLFMSLHSPFTELFHMERLHAMLEPGERAAEILSQIKALRTAAPAERESRARELPPWLQESLGWHAQHFPPGKVQENIDGLLSAYEAALCAGPDKTISALRSALLKLLARGNVHVSATGSHDNCLAALAELDGLITKLPAVDNIIPKRVEEDVVLYSAARRNPGLKNIVHAALSSAGGTSGTILARSPGVFYEDADEENLWRFLALKFLSGGGPHALFMKTWDAGLAYSNGVNASPANGKFSYYAERSPDLVRTMAFVASACAAARASTRFDVDYALANCFVDYRGGDTTSARGHAAASDLIDGVTPEIVRKFKSALLLLGTRADAAEKINARLAEAAGRVVIMKDKPLSAAGARTLVVAPSAQSDRYGSWLAEQGEKAPLVTLYPRDFWVL
jgi:Zn-dependent M16 (insulinase) family peptidase